MSDARLGDSRTASAVAAVLVGPHELGHAVPAWLAGLKPSVTLLPQVQGAIPLGRFDAAIGPLTPTSAARISLLRKPLGPLSDLVQTLKCWGK